MMAANAPVAICWLVAIAPLEALALADADEDAAVADPLAEVEEAAELELEDAELVDERAAADAELTWAATAVAFKVPHFSASVQVCWA